MAYPTDITPEEIAAGFKLRKVPNPNSHYGSILGSNSLDEIEAVVKDLDGEDNDQYLIKDIDPTQADKVIYGHQQQKKGAKKAEPIGPKCQNLDEAKKRKALTQDEIRHYVSGGF